MWPAVFFLRVEGEKSLPEEIQLIEQRLCFYCGYPTGQSERAIGDHFPIPKACGGTATVHACWACHNTKDNLSIEKVFYGIPGFYRGLTGRDSGYGFKFFEIARLLLTACLDESVKVVCSNWDILNREQRIVLARLIHNGYAMRSIGKKPKLSPTFCSSLVEAHRESFRLKEMDEARSNCEEGEA